MATVYKGYQEDIDRYVAIKVLPPHPGLDAQFIERFKLEGAAHCHPQYPASTTMMTAASCTW
jgi:hypothetical protein